MALKQFVVKDARTIRDDILRTIKNGLVAQGVASPYIGPASDWHIIASALGNELAVVGANCVVKADAMMPDTATGDDLKRIADLLDRSLRAAAGSVGFVVLSSSADSPVETGRQLTDAAGLRYEVTIGKTYADGDLIPVRAIDVGAATNHDEGDLLQWAAAPPYADDKAAVATGGLTNGVGAEDDEALRARVIDVFRNPPGAGNPEQIIESATESSPSVQGGFAFPAIQGPGTVHVAVTAAPTSTSKSRVVASATMSGTVTPYIQGKIPPRAYSVITTVADVNADVAFAVSLPESPTANPPGPGGGWKNGTPWPAPDGVTTFRCTVTVAASSTTFTVDATTAPTPGVTRVAWLSPYDWTLYTGLVTASSGSSGAYVVTVDSPFVDIAVGCYVWPDCLNAQAYVDAVLARFALMGPGEKSSNASALERGFRHQIPAQSYPYSVDHSMLRALSDAGDEVLSAAYFHRTDGTTTLTGSAGKMTPQVPAAVTDAPNVYVPRHIGFYRDA
jgi:uncharacterized phage protein gp47/JayE